MSRGQCIARGYGRGAGRRWSGSGGGNRRESVAWSTEEESGREGVKEAVAGIRSQRCLYLYARQEVKGHGAMDPSCLNGWRGACGAS